MAPQRQAAGEDTRERERECEREEENPEPQPKQTIEGTSECAPLGLAQTREHAIMSRNPVCAA